MKDDVVSSTALTVLQGLLYTARKDEFSHLVSQETVESCEKILQTSNAGRKRLKQLDSKLFNLSVPYVEKLMVPGITLHYALRKKTIEDFVTNAISKGFTQIVNLGAGFDTLAYRLSKTNPDITFIEIDHPATQVAKKEALVEENIENLHLLSVDFSKQTLKDELREFKDFDSNKDTVFISEGVLMYLDEVNVKDLFHSLKDITSSNMEFIFTFIEPMSENKDSYGILLNIYLKLKKEHLYWNIKTNELQSFLNSIDYSLEEIIGADKFKTLYLPNTNTVLHRGEIIAVAK